MNIGRWQVLWGWDPRDWILFTSVLPGTIVARHISKPVITTYAKVYSLWFIIGPLELRRFR